MSADREQALREIAAIAARHGLEPGEVAAVLQDTHGDGPAERSSSVLARVLAYLGAILVLAGVALFIGMKWEFFNSATRVLVTLGTGFAVYLFALAAARDARFEKVVTPMFLVAALLQPTGLVVMLNEYAQGGDPEHGLLFMCATMLLQQLFTFLALKRTVLLFIALFFGAAGFGTLCDILGIDAEFVLLALGAGLFLLARVLDRGPHRGIAPFWYLAGSSFFLAGVFDLLEGTVLEILFFGVAAAVMYLATVLRSKSLLLVSVVALISFTGYFFRDSLANAFGLIVMGLLLIGLSAFAMSLNRKYITRPGANSANRDNLREHVSD